MRTTRKEKIEQFVTDKSNTYIGRLIGKRMLESDYSYVDVAERSGGASAEHIGMIVSGKRRSPQFNTIVRISKALDIPLDKFVEEKGK